MALSRGHFKTNPTMYATQKLLAALLFVANSAAIAQTACTATSWTVTGSYLGANNTGQGDSPGSACAKLAANMKANGNWAYPDTPTSSVSGTGNSRVCTVKQADSAPSPGFAFASYPTCTEGAFTPSCGEAAGTTKVVNWTVGYARTPAFNDYDMVTGTVNTIPTSKQICSDSCVRDLGQGVAAWQSQTPTTQGLYRWSVDIASKSTGAGCSPTAADNGAQKTLAEPTCPGFVGEINGKKGCYGTAASPVNTVQGERPTQGEKEAGNPAAGPKPLTGEGSGATGATRTPAAGTGGPAGGPTSAGVNAAGTGTKATVAGQEQLACGAPGQPKCAIDESGVGDGKTAYVTANTESTAVQTSMTSAIDGAKNISAPSWSFSFALPTGCTPYNTGIKGFVMNPCQYQGVIHDLMSMVWAAVTLFFIIGMVGRTIRES